MLKAYNDLDKENFKTGAIKDFAVIGQVYSEVVQIVVRGDLKDKVKSLADLKGMRVSVGDAGSGVYNNAKTLFEAYGMTLKDIQENNLSVGDSANAMKDDQLDAFFFTAGVPTTAITELATSMDVFMLSLGDDVIADFIANNKLDGKYEVYSKQPITNEHYSFIPKDEPAYTIGVTATFIMSNEVSEEIAYNVTKALWENKDQIAKGHVVGTSMNRDNAVLTIGNVPVHPGALKYYKEVGVIK
jgi:TRAP transporter TAXI family solute receptor